MAEHAADVGIWDVEARSVKNRLVEPPTVEDLDPCHVARKEIRELRKENFRLRDLVHQTPSNVTEVPADEKVKPLPRGRHQFDDRKTVKERRDLVKDALKSIGGDTLVIGGSDDLVTLNCGGMVAAPNDVTTSTGGVFVLVGRDGLLVSQGSTPTSGTTYSPSTDPNSETSLEVMRTHIRQALLHQGDVQVFVSKGLLQVPCKWFINRPAILYGRLGVSLRGDAIKTTGGPVPLDRDQRTPNIGYRRIA